MADDERDGYKITLAPQILGKAAALPRTHSARAKSAGFDLPLSRQAKVKLS
jgi:hypothetical protein